jgi:uncharacterized membrane protein YdjX (TVP38/TMEM64 family)
MADGPAIADASPAAAPVAAGSVTLTGAVLGYATLGPGIGAALLAPLAVAHADTLAAGGAGTVIAVVAAVTLLCGLALLPTFVATVLLCWLYGPLGGFVLAVGSYAVAALLGWSLARTLGRRGMESLVSRHPRLAVVRDALVRSTFLRSARTVLLLRISPVIPFALINATAGVAGARADGFVVGTALGLLPRAGIVAAWAAKLQYLTFERSADFVLLGAGVAVTLGVLALLGWWGRAALREAGIESTRPAAA